MTNTLLKIATLKEKMNRKNELCTLVVSNWLQELDADIEECMWITVKETLLAYKNMHFKLQKLEAKLKLSGIEK